MCRPLATATAILTLAVAACTPGTSTSNPNPTTPHVTLHVPETVVSRGAAQLVIDSQGRTGQTVQLYVFRENFGTSSTCSDTSVRPIAVELRGGPQQVTIDIGQPGDLWLVMTGDGFQTKCGESRTRALIDPLPELAPACINNSGVVSCPKTWPTYEAGKISYRLSAGVPPKGSLAVTVSWVGPFASAPEAQVSPCPATPIAGQDTRSLEHDPTVATSNGDPAGHGLIERKIERPGVYRLMLSIPATPYTAAYEATCEGAPLVTVKQ